MNKHLSLQRINCGGKSFHRCNNMKRKRFVTSVAPESNVLIDYVTLYTQYMCSADAQTCMNTVILPPINEQYDIVKNYLATLHELQRIHNLEGLIFRLCATHENEALEALKLSINDMNNANAVIQSIIEYVRDQPLPSDLTTL